MAPYTCSEQDYESGHGESFTWTDSDIPAKEIDPLESDLDLFLEMTIPTSDGISQPTAWNMYHFEREDGADGGIMDDYEGITTYSPSFPTTLSSDDQLCLSPDRLSREDSLSTDTHEPSIRALDQTTMAQQQTQERFLPIAPKDPNTHLPSSRRSQDMPILALQHNLPRRPGRGRTKLPSDKLKKNIRKATRPEKCRYCGEGFGWWKGLKRHLCSTHRTQALQDGLINEKDVQKTQCPRCPTELERPDYLPKHMRNKHGATS